MSRRRKKQSNGLRYVKELGKDNPKRLRTLAYAQYQASDVWKAKRKAALEAAGHACQLCNRVKKLQVHHRTYERVGGDELPGDLTVLCAACHRHFHGIGGGPKRHVKPRQPQQKTKQPRDLSRRDVTFKDLEAIAEQMNARIKDERKESKSRPEAGAEASSDKRQAAIPSSVGGSQSEN